MAELVPLVAEVVAEVPVVPVPVAVAVVAVLGFVVVLALTAVALFAVALIAVALLVAVTLLLVAIVAEPQYPWTHYWLYTRPAFSNIPFSQSRFSFYTLLYVREPAHPTLRQQLWTPHQMMHLDFGL